MLKRDSRGFSSVASIANNLLGRHACRTKLPPKNFLFDTKSGLKNAKTIQNVFEKCLAPLRPLKSCSLALFNKF